MVTFLRNALISFLIFTLSGCASYAPAYLPAEAPLAEEDSKPSQTDGEINTLHDENARVVKVGQEVKITTNDGENQIGAVLPVTGY
ncbi:MAG: putative small lipoprotein YifL [Candidatus Krumholzibacteriia bacterium]|jgi:predicted small lipoprotein YifL